MRAEPGDPLRNRLIDALPPAARRKLEKNLARVTLDRGHVLSEPGAAREHIHFPRDCIISLVAPLLDGRSAETGTIGREGALGIALAPGDRFAFHRAVVQVPGELDRVPAHVVDQLVRSDPSAQDVFLRYGAAFLAQTMQLVACNTLHGTEARLAKFLLLSQDRSIRNVLPLTQEFLAEMLGVRRTTANEAARHLQASGLIRYARGRITILDREGLGAAACECYHATRREFSRLLPQTYS